MVIIDVMCTVCSSPRPYKPKPALRKRTDDTSSYAEEVATEIRPPWQMMKTNDALPPRALTVTSVSQAHDLQVIKVLNIPSVTCSNSSY